MPGEPGTGVGGSTPVAIRIIIVAKHTTMNDAIVIVTPVFVSSDSTAITITYAASSGLYGPPVR